MYIFINIYAMAISEKNAMNLKDGRKGQIGGLMGKGNCYLQLIIL